MIKKIYKKIIDYIYPKRCPICDDILINDIVHPHCLRKVKYINDNSCTICGKFIGYENICEDCKKYKHYFDIGFSVFIFRGNIKESIYRFKYSGRKEYSKFFALEMSKIIISSGLDFDILIPVPIHKTRLKSRGYNQAKILSDEMSKILNKPSRDNIIKRVKKTKALKELSRLERIETMKNSMKLLVEVKNKNILIVDDIYTTGSTVDSCAKLLKDSGAKNVYVITIAS